MSVNINPFFFTLLLFTSSVFSVSAQQGENNKYGLDAISSLEEYQELIDGQPEKALVRLDEFIPSLVLDIRYSTSNNLMEEPMYESAEAYASLPTAKALKAIQEELRSEGYGLKVFDAYRPYSVTVAFYEKVRDTVFVASPYTGSRHNRGCAVDLTLIDLETGEQLEMPTPFDDFTEVAHTDYPDLPEKVIQNRELLKRVMTKHGFQIYPDEWWHYDLNGWENHPILDMSFEQLKQIKKSRS